MVHKTRVQVFLDNCLDANWKEFKESIENRTPAEFLDKLQIEVYCSGVLDESCSIKVEVFYTRDETEQEAKVRVANQIAKAAWLVDLEKKQLAALKAKYE